MINGGAKEREGEQWLLGYSYMKFYYYFLAGSHAQEWEKFYNCKAGTLNPCYLDCDLVKL